MAKPKKNKAKVSVEEAVEKALDEMLDEVLEEVGKEVVEEESAVQVTEPEKSEKSPFSVIENKMRVYENVILNIPKAAKRVVVENLGGGDLYAGIVSVSFNPKNRLKPGESKTFNNIDKLFIGSASRPTYRISFYD